MGTIEEAIKQRKFTNEYEKAIVNILFTASWLDATNIQHFKPYGISPQQFNVLRILRGSYPNALRLSDITERMIDKNSNATRLVEKLRTKNFVKREICKHNRRQVDIWITQKGLDLLAELDKLRENFEEQFKGLSKQDVQQLNMLLDKMRG
ncbi:MAG: MarR family transcriptional regulator [Bacteroidia bacterium]|nr:MarR family transcriptional regulator [Bacteroidia bacterium]